MKKLLALVLALVMTLGLATVGTNAAYSDEADITLTEAAEVMTALKVFDGQDGAFNPKGNLTREAGAKIIASMIIGRTAADALANQATQFTDVAADRWSAGPIAFCASENIIGGMNAEGTIFAPTDNLTGYQFAKMCLVALGYDPDLEGLYGETFTINTAKLALSAGLLTSLDNVVLSQPLTREQAAQMALNTEQATMVDYEGGIKVSGSDNLSLTVAASRKEVANTASTYVTGTQPDGYVNGTSGTMQFCEKYATKLTKNTTGTDDFGRPLARTWSNNGVKVDTVVKTPVATFNAKTSAADVATALNSYWINYTGETTRRYITNAPAAATSTTAVGDPTVTDSLYTGASSGVVTVITGTTTSPAKAIADLTATGKLVEIYANSSTNEITDIVAIQYKVTQVGATTSNSTRATYTIDNTPYIDYVATDTDDTIEIAKGAEIARGDYITYTIKNGVCYVYPTTKVEGDQTNYYTSSAAQTTITVDGTTYKVGSGVIGYNTESTYTSNTAGIFYLDQFGHVVARTGVAASSNYAWIIDAYGTVTSSLGSATPSIQVRAVLADGTVGTYDLALTKITSGSTGSIAIGQAPANKGLADKSNVTENENFEDGDYVIKNTNIMVYNADNAGQLVSQYNLNNSAYMKNAVLSADLDLYGYAISGDTMTIEPLDTLPTVNSTASATHVYKTTLTGVANAKTNYTVNGATVFADGTTKFVVYNPSSKTASVYTGASNLPSSVTDLTGYTVLKTGTTKSSGTASVIFAQSSSIYADALSNYVYIDSTKYDTVATYGSKTNVKIYSAKLPSGDSVSLYDPNSVVTANGLYNYNADNEVSSQLANTGNVTPNKTYYLYDNSVKLSNNGTLLGVGPDSSETFYYVTKDTAIIYIDTTVDGINNSSAFVVLDSANGQRNGNVAAIYVVGGSKVLTTSDLGATPVAAIETALLTSDSVVVDGDVTIEDNTLQVGPNKVVSFTGNVNAAAITENTVTVANVQGSVYIGGTLTVPASAIITGTSTGKIRAGAIASGATALTVNYVDLDVAGAITTTGATSGATVGTLNVNNGAKVAASGAVKATATNVGAASASTLSVGASSDLTAITLANNSTLNVNGNTAGTTLTLGCTVNVADDAELTLSGTTSALAVTDDATINGKVTYSGAAAMALSTGNLTVNGTLTAANGGATLGIADGKTLTIKNGSTVTVGGAINQNTSGHIILDGTLIEGGNLTGTVDIQGNGALEFKTLANPTQANFGAIAVPTVTVTGNLTMDNDTSNLIKPNDVVTSLTLNGASAKLITQTDDALDLNNAVLTIDNTSGVLTAAGKLTFNKNASILGVVTAASTEIKSGATVTFGTAGTANAAASDLNAVTLAGNLVLTNSGSKLTVASISDYSKVTNNGKFIEVDGELTSEITLPAGKFLFSYASGAALGSGAKITFNAGSIVYINADQANNLTKLSGAYGAKVIVKNASCTVAAPAGTQVDGVVTDDGSASVTNPAADYIYTYTKEGATISTVKYDAWVKGAAVTASDWT